MKRLMVSLAAGLFTFVSGVACAADVVEVPDSSASTGPALTPFSDWLVMAWAGEAGISSHPVWYSVFNGTSFTAQAQVRGALTSTAPALAVAGGKLYLATTPPNENDRIYSYEATGLEFVSDGVPLCDEQTCARTRAAPALLGVGTTLFAAWTSLNGEIMVAARTNGVWSIAAEPIPDAVTSPTTGPTLALY
ncbi:MAG TPA: hypothetical protein VK437_09825, partial [Steroidobacteraceae bacterium]|nr:hypothetical protein [Steroidobacteraceae bacterium]